MNYRAASREESDPKRLKRNDTHHGSDPFPRIGMLARHTTETDVQSVSVVL